MPDTTTTTTSSTTTTTTTTQVIVSQPYLYSDDIVYARSPVIYAFKNCSSTLYTYKFVLYCTTGLTSDLTTIYASIDRTPDTNGCIFVDASSLLRSYLKNNYNITYSGNYFIYFTAKLVEYASGVINKETSTNISVASLGYINDATGGFNDDVETGEYMLSYIPDTTEIRIPTFLNYIMKYKYISGDSTGYKISYTSLTTTTTTLAPESPGPASLIVPMALPIPDPLTNEVSFTTAWTAGSNASTNTMKEIACGYYDIITTHLHTDIDQTQPIKLRIMNNSTILSTYMLYPYPCLEDLYPVDFININGVVDTIYFIGRVTTYDTIEYETYKYDKVNYLTATYNSASGSYHKLFTTGRIKLVLNTGWIDEDYNLKLEQLFLSEYVWIYGKPYIVTDKEMMYKTNRYDRMINYIVTLEAGYDRINNVK